MNEKEDHSKMDPRKEGEEVGVDANSDMMGVRTRKEKKKNRLSVVVCGESNQATLFLICLFLQV